MPSINRESGEKPRSIVFYVFLGAALFDIRDGKTQEETGEGRSLI